MAKDKKSFLFYNDWGDVFDSIDDETAGKLIKHLCDYVRDKNPQTDDMLINAVFANIKSTLKRDLDKWHLKSLKNKENANKRWEKHRSEKIPKDANACDRTIRNAKNADKDIVNVIDIDNDKVIVKGKEISKDIIKTYVKCLQHFPGHLIPKTEKEKINWITTVEKLNRIDKIPLEWIERITQRARSDDFWSQNFLSLPKLRKKNPENLMYIQVFHEKFKNNGTKQHTTKNGQPDYSSLKRKIANTLTGTQPPEHQ